MTPKLNSLAQHLIPGDGSSALSRAHRRGTLVRIATGQYVETRTWIDLHPDARFRLMAIAEQHSRPGTILVGQTALFLRGIPMLRPRAVEATTPHHQSVGLRPTHFRVHGSTPEAITARGLPVPRLVHRLAAPTWPAVVERHGLVLESVLGATAGMLAHPDVRSGLCLADGLARWLGRPSLEGWEQLAQELEGRFSGRRLERAKATVLHSSARSDSVGESLSRFLMLDRGLLVPELQREFVDCEGLLYADFAWPALRLIGEFDGMQKYTDPGMGGGRDTHERIRREKRRDARLEAHGQRVIHWVWDDLWAPGRLVTRLMACGVSADRRLRPWP